MSSTFAMFAQQNTCDMIKSAAFQYPRDSAEQQGILTSVGRLEVAAWYPELLAQAIDEVRPGCIQFGERRATIDGGAETLKAVVDRYYELTGQSTADLVM